MFLKTLLITTISILILLLSPHVFSSASTLADEQINSPANIPQELIIKKINLDQSVLTVEGKRGNWPVPANLPATASEKSRVGGNTNISIWGHRSGIFLNLDKLTLGDEIEVSDEKGWHKYNVSKLKVVTPNPDDGWVMEKTKDYRLTLITCTPIGSTSQRLIITASLKTN